MGYEATLADHSPNLLDIARAEFGEELIREIVESDVRDLSRWPANTFDSTIGLGPSPRDTSRNHSTSQSPLRKQGLHQQSSRQPMVCTGWEEQIESPRKRTS
ncbi:hypothetical protein JHV56_14665 [Arthrobacter sp. BHU FT2]|nr:hypothetical protein [Arthrobacter sp. BHU FT2]